jgi:transposase
MEDIAMILKSLDISPGHSEKKRHKAIKDIAQKTEHLSQINLNAAGIDVGSDSHFVAVPAGRDETTVREFKSFTEDLYRLADWLTQCGIDTVAMESTGVYWISLYEILVERGFAVKLVDARHVKNVSGRKTDVLDCQWLQQLHTYGLLQSAFIPELFICKLRAYVKQREMLIGYGSDHIQHMQKALTQMNVKLQNVVTDITGTTGMMIIKAIILGERDTLILAQHRDARCKNSVEVIAKSLVGNYREEHIFTLRQSLELYEFYREQIKKCDIEVERLLKEFNSQNNCVAANPVHPEQIAPRKKKKKKNKNDFSFDLKSHLIAMTGIDLTQIPNVEASTVLRVISVVGLDMERWKTEKHFASWLGLCPGNKVSGGKRLGGKSKRTANQAASALRLIAQTLYDSPTALGAYYRRIRSRLGAPKAITATAHKLAKIIYHMLKDKKPYREDGQDYYEQRYRDRMVKNLMRNAEKFGYELTPKISHDVLLQLT